MKNYIQLFLIIFSVFCFGQEKDLWYPFFLENSNTMGFKDKNGIVMIEPKFFSRITEDPFDNIYAANEIGGSNYYLLKNGKKIGIDSVYVFDTENALEKEEKIRFRDYKTDKVGFFDKNGKIIIPALYDEAEDFINGFAMVYKNGKRWCYDNNTQSSKNCEHYGWKGGKSFVINSKNRELFEITDRTDFSYSIDYSNFKINEKVDDEVYTSYKGSDGNTYSFYSPEKDFEKWFDTVFLPDFKKNKTVLPKYFYDLISCSDNDNPKHQTAWKNHKKADYVKIKQQKIDEIYRKLLSGIYEKNISWEKSSNNTYFPENELPKDDLKNNTIISFLPRPPNDYSATHSFQFTKIGDQFYITSAP